MLQKITIFDCFCALDEKWTNDNMGKVSDRKRINKYLGTAEKLRVADIDYPFFYRILERFGKSL